MPNVSQLEPLEIGVMFWAGTDPEGTLGELLRLGVRSGQLGMSGDLDPACGAGWREALMRTGFTVYTVVAGFDGESYADIPTVENTVGFIPRSTRAQRERRMLDVVEFAAALGVPGVAAHIGFVPEDPRDPEYIAVREIVRRICDRAAQHGQTFALETGQEPAQVLLDFIHDVNRDNLGINFDPANMILYGTGDPIEALAILGPHVLSVHCKDGNWPDRSVAGALGVEQPLGQGAVGIERFLGQLRHVGYSGPLAIEREAHDPAERMRDIEAAVKLLRELRKQIS
jgi:sugar phosphate isomerase/epimerase